MLTADELNDVTDVRWRYGQHWLHCKSTHIGQVGCKWFRTETSFKQQHVNCVSLSSSPRTEASPYNMQTATLSNSPSSQVCLAAWLLLTDVSVHG